VVPVPTIDTDTGGEKRPDGPCGTLLRLPSELLFDGDSAVLRRGADPVLRTTVREVASGATITEVAGHTADVTPDVSTPDGQLLSQQRAEAVVRRLVELGIERSQIARIHGYGDTQPVKPNFNPDGSFNEALAAKNRRVEITTARTQCEQTEENGETHD
jgi:flagellar motor protein MotB